MLRLGLAQIRKAEWLDKICLTKLRDKFNTTSLIIIETNDFI